MSEEKKTTSGVDAGIAAVIAGGLVWALTRKSAESDDLVIVASAGEHGTISPAGQQKVIKGATLVFTFTPEDGYIIEDVIVDGVSRGAVQSYIFANITASHSIYVSFGTEDTTGVWFVMAVRQFTVQKALGDATWLLMAEGILTILKDTQATSVWKLMAGPAALTILKGIGTSVWMLMATGTMSIQKSTPLFGLRISTNIDAGWVILYPPPSHYENGAAMYPPYSSVTVEARPYNAAAYIFDRWSGDYDNSSASFTLNLWSNHSLIANFKAVVAPPAPPPPPPVPPAPVGQNHWRIIDPDSGANFETTDQATADLYVSYGWLVTYLGYY